jgi:hypothetical protein
MPLVPASELVADRGVLQRNEHLSIAQRSERDKAAIAAFDPRAFAGWQAGNSFHTDGTRATDGNTGHCVLMCAVVGAWHGLPDASVLRASQKRILGAPELQLGAPRRDRYDAELDRPKMRKVRFSCCLPDRMRES